MRSNTRGFRGFTLIELLVVVAIIALLISILLPSLSSARATARMVKCHSIVKQFYNANHMYADANNGDYVPVKTALGTNGGSYYSWLSTANSYSAGITFRQMLGIRTNQSPLDAMPCPDRPDPFAFSSSLAWSEIAIMPSQGWGMHLGVQRPKVLLPATKMMMTDATDWHIFGQGNVNYKTRWDITGELQNNSVAYRHKEGSSVLHFDGHASYYGKAELYSDQAPERSRILNIYAK